MSQKPSSPPDETFEETVSGIHSAITYVADESKKLGLWFTAHLLDSAALLALGEYEDIQHKLKAKKAQTHYRKQ